MIFRRFHATYWSKFARYYMTIPTHLYTDIYIKRRIQAQGQVVWAIATNRVAPGRRLAKKMEVGWKRTVGGKWTKAIYTYICACAKRNDIAIASFDVNGNTGSTTRGFLARIGCDFTTNRSHRAVDFFRPSGIRAIAKEMSYVIRYYCNIIFERFRITENVLTATLMLQFWS